MENQALDAVTEEKDLDLGVSNLNRQDSVSLRMLNQVRPWDSFHERFIINC